MLLQGSLTPQAELFERTRRFQGHLRDLGIELAMLRQNADLYYFTGTVQDGHLFIPAHGEPLFLVWRVFERAIKESALRDIRPLSGMSGLNEALKEKGLLDAAVVGLELDCLPAALYLYYSKNIWPGARFVDVTHAVRLTRAVKSRWEIDRIREACVQVAEAVACVQETLREGLTELELSSQIETRLRLQGHPGYLRMRGWNQECGMGHVLSGADGAMPSWTNTPGGGLGTSPAYGLGAGTRTIRTFEPVCIDFGGSSNGYLCDQTRLFCIKGLPERLLDAYKAVLEVHQGIKERLVPGASCSSIYDWAINRMEGLGYAQNFMGFGRNQVIFIGHGLGVEVDEYPFLSRKNPMPLAEGMVVAVEPKLVFPDEGIVGIEDTYLITQNGAERLTTSPQELIIC
ncbi:MAG: M24 family metallopeptidase [Dissulfurimicrobium sp.]|uniref:M24 family metallopeptidase n=1 Tax=Dissulfurimicrobium hydrothermale TaxID=1750598 RepID=UPI003C7533BD